MSMEENLSDARSDLRQRAEEALSASEERFRAIADYTYDWETWFGTDGRPHWINPAVERISGRTVGECMAMTDYPIPLVHHGDKALIARHVEIANNQGSAHDIEFRVRRMDGSVVWLALSYLPIFDAEGLFMGSRWSMRNISNASRRKRLFLKARHD